MERQERIAIVKAIWRIGQAAGVDADKVELICHALEDELVEIGRSTIDIASHRDAVENAYQRGLQDGGNMV